MDWKRDRAEESDTWYKKTEGSFPSYSPWRERRDLSLEEDVTVLRRQYSDLQNQITELKFLIKELEKKVRDLDWLKKILEAGG
jgi:uncharacterized protein YlxW (UPF0749 family)